MLLLFQKFQSAILRIIFNIKKFSNVFSILNYLKGKINYDLIFYSKINIKL